MPLKVRIESAVAERWSDLERLFGARGACGGCWCMWYRLQRAEYERKKGAGNRAALRRLLGTGEPAGVIAYAAEEPIGWCSVAPRMAYARLERARLLKPLDDQPVWSVVCTFVTPTHRRRGVSVMLLRGAVAYAKSQGARIVEGYPVEPRSGAMPGVFAHPGTSSAFRSAGFREVARPSPTRVIMRCFV
jgi:GNAT superfamily N-acetyltransferase